MEFEHLKKKSNESIDMYYGGCKPKNVFVDKITGDIITYTHNELVHITTLAEKAKCKEFIEGTTLSIFFHNGWVISTSSFLDANNCFWKSDKSILELAKECVPDWHHFLEQHNKDFLYLYTLIHFENIHLIDYSYKFGPEYKKLELFMKRNLKSNVVDMYYNEISIDHLKQWNDEDQNIKSSNLIKHAGIIVFDEENISKILTNTYQTVSLNKKFRTVGTFEYYNQLYRQNKLHEYFKRFPDERYWNGRDIFLLIKNMYNNLIHEISHLSEFQEKLIEKRPIAILKSLNDNELLELIDRSKQKSIFRNFLLYVYKD